MKLPDFKEHALLNALRKAMDAPYLDVELPGEELIKWLEKDESETLGFSGMRVLIYTRDISNGILLKFHIAHCGALTKRINENRSWKYVVTTRKDGDFVVHHYKGGGGFEIANERLEVCKRCLTTLDYKGYSRRLGETPNARYLRRKAIYAEFSIREFFERYDKTQAVWSPLYKYYGYTSRHHAGT